MICADCKNTRKFTKKFNMKYIGRIVKLHRNSQGFTVTELLVVIAIIGIMAAIAIPNFASYAANYRLKAAARIMYSNMQRARLHAIKENTFVCLNFTTVVYPATGGGYTIFVDNGAGGGVAGNAVQDGGEITLDAVTMDNQSSLVNAAFGAVPRFSYTAKGMVAGSQTGNVIIRNNQRRYRITVSAGGGLRLEISTDGVSWVL